MRKADDVQKITKFRRLTGSVADAFDRDVKREYEGGKTIRAIVAESGRSYGAVYRALQRAGVQFRARGSYLQQRAASADGCGRCGAVSVNRFPPGGQNGVAAQSGARPGTQSPATTT